MVAKFFPPLGAARAKKIFGMGVDARPGRRVHEIKGEITLTRPEALRERARRCCELEEDHGRTGDRRAAKGMGA